MLKTSIVPGAALIAALLACPRARGDEEPDVPSALFARENLVAWCIVPFDGKKRGPAERAEMLQRLGFHRFAYDWRAEHLPTFDAEITELAKRGIRLEAVWFPGSLGPEARALLDVLRKRGIRTQLWVLIGDPTGASREERVAKAADALRPVVDEAALAGCTVALYNHGGWFGDPENQIAILERLARPGTGIVYNLHHGHEHLDRFPELLGKMLPHLKALVLNGMVRGGDAEGRKILPLGQGDLDLELLRTIARSGYRGPIGILGHTLDDAEARLEDNLDGLDWLVERLLGEPAGERPIPRTPVPLPREEAALVGRIAAEAREKGDPRRGALVFASDRFACISCHRVGPRGGTVGPDLSAIGTCQSPEFLVESILWPARSVQEPFRAWTFVTSSGEVHRGYRQGEQGGKLTLRVPSRDADLTLDRGDIVQASESGTLMPDGLAAGMTDEERRDLVRFLASLGVEDGPSSFLARAHAPVSFPYDRAPLEPGRWPSWNEFVNRDRVYDFYAKEAAHFLSVPEHPVLLPPYPGMDGGKYGHWGNQDEKTWADDRWKRTDLGNVLAGVFHGPGITVPKGVCVRLGDRGELSACFDPETLGYPAVWSGGFVRLSGVRHGFMDGLVLDGSPLPRAAPRKPAGPFVYRGYYRHGSRVAFAYRLGDTEMLDAPWVENGAFVNVVAPAESHPLAHLTRGGPPRWPQRFEVRGKLGAGGPHAIDDVPLPFENPWRALLFPGGHDFLPGGSAVLATMQGDVWRADGLDERLERVVWRRIASGLHQALGVVVSPDGLHVLGRDQITRLEDLNGDGEMDLYACVTNAQGTSPAGHDFICGLERDARGDFYTASGNQGLIRIRADGSGVDVLATGLRNPDGLAIAATGADGRAAAITAPSSEGEWTPASMVCEVRISGRETGAAGDPPHFGYGGPRGGRPPALPLVYLPRGLDNSSGGQVAVSGGRWGIPDGLLVHLSYGAGSHFLLLRDAIDGEPQGAVVPLPGEFLSGAHRGRFSPGDGQLWVSGMGGWGTYTILDGSFQRVRYTGGPVELPVALEAHENGVRIAFTDPVDAVTAANPRSHFAQAWNYRYGSGYGSQELSPSHPGTAGHDSWRIAGAHVLEGGRSIFLEIPDIQPVSQLHLHVRAYPRGARDIFATVHRLRPPFTAIPDYQPREKTIAARPILSDMKLLEQSVPNPWRKRIPGARDVAVEAGKNLTYATRSITVRAGEAVNLAFWNPDVVPHNWVLARPGSLERVGGLANRIIAEPDAAARHYVPRSEDVLVYTDIVPPGGSFEIWFRAPAEKGRYPYLCTFPGHWMVMNGVMVVE